LQDAGADVLQDGPAEEEEPGSGKARPRRGFRPPGHLVEIGVGVGGKPLEKLGVEIGVGVGGKPLENLGVEIGVGVGGKPLENLGKIGKKL